MEFEEDAPKPKKKKITKSIDPKSITSDQIKKLLKETLIENLMENKKRSNLEIDAMVATMEEFLRSFILIGYSLKNEPIVVTHAKTQLDADALHTSLYRLFMSMNGGSGMSL